ncbi:UNVERIFIED_CONTAM: hypothetical protein FKN15_074853 [Acipenser sinensis]
MAHRLGASAAENRAVPLGRGDAFIATNISEADCDVTQKGYEKKRAKLLAPYVPQTRGDVTQKGYEKKRAKLLAPYVPQTRGFISSLVQLLKKADRLAGPVCS